MNKLLNKIVSGITTISLGMAMAGTMPAVADETAATSTVRTLSIDFMGRGATPQESSPGKARLTADDVGKEFWVGVAVDNVNDLPLFTDGIYSLEIAFEYDPDFVEPYFTNNDAETEWASALASGNLAAANNSTWWSTDQYEIISVTETDIDTVTDRENTDVMTQRADDGWKMCTVCVTLKDGSAFDGARFKDLAEATKQYLLKLPFKLNSVPAEGAADPNPTVLSLVRGPETFDIGSGETGTDPYSAWEATVTDPDDATNMKTLFTFAGDISLFDAGMVIEDIVPVKLKTGDETDDTTYTLSSTKDLNLDGFKAETLDYYLSVSNETEKIMLKITSSDLPTVVANSASVTATLLSDKLYETAEFDLAEIDKTVESDGYNNTVTVTAGGVTYTLHIRRLLKPKIELNYGNSPYGEIMKADNIAEADKQAAKEAFNEKNIYSVYIPESVEKKIRASTGTSKRLSTNISTYPYRAWVDVASLTNATEEQLADLNNPDINMDRNDYAIFVYNCKPFVDPGFVATDSLGNTIETVDREITVNRMTRGLSIDGIYDGNYIDQTVEMPDTPSEYLVEDVTTTYVQGDSSKALIRPDKYVMTYSFTDSLTGEKVEEDRYVIILQPKGDTNFSNTINLQDLNPVYQYFNKSSQYFKLEGSDHVITGTARQIYLYRCLDLLSTSTVNLQDLNPIYQAFNVYAKLSDDEKAANNNPVEEWYVELPDSLTN